MIGDKIIEVHLRQTHDPIENDLKVHGENDGRRQNLTLLVNREDADGICWRKDSAFIFRNSDNSPCRRAR